MLKDLFAIAKFISRHPLTQDHKFKALMSFVRWQIGTRFLGRQVVVPWVEDAKFITSRGETGLTGNVYTGFMEYEDMGFLLHALQGDETFVDVGSNVGAFTILASKVVGVNSIAFEPVPETVERLKDQMQINRLNDVVSVRNNGVGDQAGKLFFTNNNDTINKVSLKGGENTTEVEVVTLDDVLDKTDKYIFKIDVEGYEYNVIEGGKDILSSPNTSAIIIELNGSGEEFGHSDEEIHTRLIELNFIPVRYDPKARFFTQLEGYNKDGSNTIYVKDLNAITAQCKAAPKRCVHTTSGVYI